MGLIDFVKDAGAKLLGFGDDDDKRPAEAPEVTGKSLEEIRALSLEKKVRELGLEVENLGVTVDGTTAIVRGSVPNQATREKVVLCCGNNAGIAHVDDRLDVEQEEPEATLYTVVSGDTLSGIAKAHYGNAMKYPVIFEANRPMLEDPDKIYPGQVLRIPPLED